MIKPNQTAFQQSWKHEYDWRSHTMLWPSVFFFSFLMNCIVGIFRDIPTWLTYTYLAGSIIFGVWFFVKSTQFISSLKKSIYVAKHPKKQDRERKYIPSFMKDAFNIPWQRTLANAFDPYCTIEQQNQYRAWLKEHQKEWVEEFHKKCLAQQEKAQELRLRLPTISSPPVSHQKRMVKTYNVMLYVLFVAWVTITLSLHWNFILSLIGGSVIVSQWVKFQNNFEKKTNQQLKEYVNHTQKMLKAKNLTHSDCIVLAFDPSLDDTTRKMLVDYLNISEPSWTSTMEHLPLYLMKLSVDQGEEPIVPLLDCKNNEMIATATNSSVQLLSSTQSSSL